MTQKGQNLSLREELAWFIVNRMNDSVGFDEAYEEVGEYLKLIEKRIDLLFRSVFEDMSKKLTKEETNLFEGFYLTIYQKKIQELLK